MRKNLPVTNNQYDYDASQRIVSTTDTKGRLTYTNDDFISISGFTEDELIGKNHNMVRPPLICRLRPLMIYGKQSKLANHGWVSSKIVVRMVITIG